MARLPRLTVPSIPYHVTQRGNWRQPVFFSADDRQTYLRLLHEQTTRFGL
jgi:putative transposase